MPRRKGPAKRTQAEQAEFEIIFPYKDVKISGDRTVVVRQWDIDTGVILSARVVALIQKLQGKVGELSLDEVIQVAKPEVLDLVATTIGWTVAELKARATMEDFMDLFQAVIDTSLVREDGSGVLPKVVGLASALVPLIGTVAGSRSQAPSTSSSAPDTH